MAIKGNGSPPSPLYLRYQELEKKAKLWDNYQRRLARQEAKLEDVDEYENGRVNGGEYAKAQSLKYKIHKIYFNAEGERVKIVESTARSVVPDEETLLRIRDMASLQATEAEICGCLGITQATFITLKDEFPEIQETIDNARSDGAVSLRRTQFKLADTNAAMAIHLGKHVLGQHEKTVQDVNVNIFDAMSKLTKDDYIIEAKVVDRPNEDDVE